VADIIQIRRDTAANWASANPTLAQGELGTESDTTKIKIGDGTTAWNSLGYLINTVDGYTYGRNIFTATASQTTFSVTYTVGYVDVYMNGVKLILGTDYTATDGTSVVLTVGASSGDIIEIIDFKTFAVANALQISDLGVSVQAYSAVLDATTASFTTAEETKLAGIATGAEVNDATTLLDADIGVNVQAHSAVLDATTASFTTADETKLDGIEVGATADQTSIVGISGTTAQFNTANTDGTFAISGGAFHDGFSDFVANEHIDWTSTSSAFSTTGTLASGALTVTGTGSTTGNFTVGSAGSAGHTILAVQGATGGALDWYAGATRQWEIYNTSGVLRVYDIVTNGARADFTTTGFGVYGNQTITSSATTGFPLEIVAPSVTTGRGIRVTVDGITGGSGILAQTNSATMNGAMLDARITHASSTGYAIFASNAGTGDAVLIDNNGSGNALSADGGNIVLTNGQYIEEYAATGTSGAVTIDLDTGNNFSTAMAGAVTYTFSNAATSGTVSSFTLKVVNDGNAITWPASVDWPAATAPTLSASGATDVFVFYTHDGGTTWYGFTAGQGMA
jgi:hypothetical protein